MCVSVCECIYISIYIYICLAGLLSAAVTIGITKQKMPPLTMQRRKMQLRLWLGRRESLSRLRAGEGIALPRLAVQKCCDSELPNGWGTALQSCRLPTFLGSSEGLQ